MLLIESMNSCHEASGFEVDGVLPKEVSTIESGARGTGHGTTESLLMSPSKVVPIIICHERISNLC